MPHFKNHSAVDRVAGGVTVPAGETAELEGTGAFQARQAPYFDEVEAPAPAPAAPKKKRKYTRRKKVAAVPEAEPVATEGAGSDTSETA